MLNPVAGIWKNLKHFQSAIVSADELQKFSLFSGLSRKQHEVILKHLHFRKYTVGEPIFEKGQTGYAVYFVNSGRVNVYYEENSEAEPIAVFEAGDFFGEVALLHPDTGRTATAVAVEDTECLALFGAELDAICEEDPRIGVVILKELARVMAIRLVGIVK